MVAIFFHISLPTYAVAVVAVELELKVTTVSATPLVLDWLTVIFGLDIALI